MKFQATYALRTAGMGTELVMKAATTETQQMATAALQSAKSNPTTFATTSLTEVSFSAYAANAQATAKSA